MNENAGPNRFNDNVNRVQKLKVIKLLAYCA
jgi:hypothetical protein